MAHIDNVYIFNKKALNVSQYAEWGLATGWVRGKVKIGRNKRYNL